MSKRNKPLVPDGGDLLLQPIQRGLVSFVCLKVFALGQDADMRPADVSEIVIFEELLHRTGVHVARPGEMQIITEGLTFHRPWVGALVKGMRLRHHGLGPGVEARRTQRSCALCKPVGLLLDGRKSRLQALGIALHFSQVVAADEREASQFQLEITRLGGVHVAFVQIETQCHNPPAIEHIVPLEAERYLQLLGLGFLIAAAPD